MSKNIIRSLKYLLWLVVTFVVVFTVMSLISYFSGSGTEGYKLSEIMSHFGNIFATTQGMILLGMILVLAVFYPKFGFVAKEVKANMKTNREQILKAFALSGFTLASESDGVMVFRCSSLFRKVFMQFEDALTVTSDDNYITIEGVRKEVIKVEFRLKSLIVNAEE